MTVRRDTARETQVQRAKDAPREKLALEMVVNVTNARKDSTEPAA